MYFDDNYGMDPFAPSRPTPSKFSLQMDDEGDALDRYDQQEEPMFSSSSLAEASVQTISDRELDSDPIMAKYEFLVNVRRLGGERRIVPLHVQQAAETLVEAASADGGRLINMDTETSLMLQNYVNQMDETCQVDPFIVISASLAISDTFTAYLEEVVHLSEFVLARVLNATFVVQVTPKMKTRPVPYNDPDLGITVSPYLGGGVSDSTRGQPFGIRESLQACSDRLDDEARLQVRAYMLSLGVMSSRLVATMDFIEDQADIFKDVLSGELRICQARKKPRTEATANELY